MKRVDTPTELAPMIELAAAEAEAAFGNPGLYLERFVTSGRHIEVQLLGDGQNVIHVGDRDCSVQRRYQKLVEEGPAPNLPLPIRTAINAAALRFGGALHYRSAGTVEFLVDCKRGEFYFLEMNARIQVEHPVTEATFRVWTSWPNKSPSPRAIHCACARKTFPSTDTPSNAVSTPKIPAATFGRRPAKLLRQNSRQGQASV